MRHWKWFLIIVVLILGCQYQFSLFPFAKSPILFLDELPRTAEELDQFGFNDFEQIDTLRTADGEDSVIAYFTAQYLRHKAIDESDTMTLLFGGDIMCHQPQLKNAYIDSTATYDFSEVFAPMHDLFQNVDFVIANLEVPVGIKPYTGFPTFSAPAALPAGLMKSGFDVLMTANNHACDKGKRGLLKTIKVLDSLGLKHTGTFADSASRAKDNLITLQKGDITIGMLNYTHSTNWLPIPESTVVNKLDTAQMKQDLILAKAKLLDKIVVFLHWGLEYTHEPTTRQQDVALFLFENGADVVIGAHPHVLQPMQRIATDSGDKVLVYSMGNLVSDQRTSPRDGGAMVQLSFVKIGNSVHLDEHGYWLTWVHKFREENKTKYQVVPCAVYEQPGIGRMSAYVKTRMNRFTDQMRTFLQDNNVAFPELKPTIDSVNAEIVALDY